ncbi:MAG TPA: aspartate/glutamate racemase family protein [Candidatus Fimenecus stercoravium]|nr:aspartate/glutamate racemase family protein [Candidatus Fimenecus stercoravium]
MQEKVLGVLGGVGPLATVYFADLVIKMTEAKTDQEHIPMVILNHASIPDRTAYILDNSKPDPLPVMIADAKRLQQDGCSCIVIPCNTAHYFYDAMQESVDIPILNILEETVSYAEKTVPNLRCIGILATEGTVVSGAYQSVIQKHNLDYRLPAKEDQASLMHIIYDQVKAGEKADICEFLRIVGALKKAGCDAVVLGCTELSIIRKDFALTQPDIVDSMECLARASILFCGKKIKEPS